MNWPFSDPENVAVFTSSEIVKDRKPILYVSHDEDDGAWQFHSGNIVSIDQSLVVSLKWVFENDKSIGDLANLPCGYIAERENLNSKWIIRKRSS